MKYKNKQKKLQARQKMYDGTFNPKKAATTRPGSEKK